ncbi:MAG: AI-2E family transporter [Muribaculaceae bacterium]
MTHNNNPAGSGYGVPRPFTFDRVVRILFSIAALLAAVWLIDILKSVLLPFLIAWLVAYLLEPFVQYNKRLLRAHGRWLPIVMTLFETILVLCAIGVFIVPSVVREMHQVADFIVRYADAGSDIPFIPPAVHAFLQQNIDFREIAGLLTREDLGNIADFAGRVISGSFGFLMSVFNWFITLLYIVFIMLDYERLLRGARHLVPPKYRDTFFKIGSDIKSSMNHYFRGQALVAFIVGILFCIGLAIVGLPMAVVMGLFIGLLNMVPYLQLISLIPTTLLCLVSSVDTGVDFWQLWWSCMAVYIIVQCIQDLILTPRIMGKAMGLNPAVILLSLSVWGTLLGFIGLIVALPLTTLLLSYYNIYIETRDDGESNNEHDADSEALEKIVED